MVGKICSSCKRPYGNVPYADPGYQPDGKMRYPIDTPAHIAAARRYIMMPRCWKKYTAEQLVHVRERIDHAAFFLHLAKNKKKLFKALEKTKRRKIKKEKRVVV